MEEKWIVSSLESDGSTEGMCWVKRGLERGLFKPDTTGNDFKVEKDVTKIADFFNIEYWKVEKAKVNRVSGLVSIMRDFIRYTIVNGYDLRINKELLTYNKAKIDSDNLRYPEFIEYSLEFMKEIFKRYNSKEFEDYTGDLEFTELILQRRKYLTLEKTNNFIT